jgi:hypothetical protein
MKIIECVDITSKNRWDVGRKSKNKVLVCLHINFKFQTVFNKKKLGLLDLVKKVESFST